MLIPSVFPMLWDNTSSLSRRVNANSQHNLMTRNNIFKLIKKGEC